MLIKPFTESDISVFINYNICGIFILYSLIIIITSPPSHYIKKIITILL